MKDEKFLQEEQLSDEELEKIAGGTVTETIYDGDLLFRFGLMDRHYSNSDYMFGWSYSSKAVDEGWAKAGITCCTVPGLIYGNQYWKDGKEISREEAHKFVKENYIKIR